MYISVLAAHFSILVDAFLKSLILSAHSSLVNYLGQVINEKNLSYLILLHIPFHSQRKISGSVLLPPTSMKTHFSQIDINSKDKFVLLEVLSILLGIGNHQGVQCCGGSQQSINTMKAYINELIPRQYFFDTNYFQLLLGLRSFQKSGF